MLYPSSEQEPVAFRSGRSAHFPLTGDQPDNGVRDGHARGPHRHPLRPGASVDAEVLLPGHAQGVILPASAVIDDGGVPVVYVEVEGETFVRHEVRVAATQADSVVVEDLPQGIRVVTRGGAAIRRAALLRSGPPEGHVH